MSAYPGLAKSGFEQLDPWAPILDLANSVY